MYDLIITGQRPKIHDADGNYVRQAKEGEACPPGHEMRIEEGGDFAAGRGDVLVFGPGAVATFLRIGDAMITSQTHIVGKEMRRVPRSRAMTAIKQEAAQ